MQAKLIAIDNTAQLAIRKGGCRVMHKIFDSMADVTDSQSLTSIGTWQKAEGNPKPLSEKNNLDRWDTRNKMTELKGGLSFGGLHYNSY